MSVDADIAELIGPPSKAAPKGASSRMLDDALASRRSRIARTQNAALSLDKHRQERKDEDPDAAPSFDITDTYGGVTVSWLSKVFRMDPSTVKQRLAECPPMHRRKAGYTYDLRVAAQYLVKPVFNAEKYLATMKPNELPQQLQSEFWKAQLARQRWEANAGHLWPSDAVMEVFAETFKVLKFTTQLWADNLEQVTGLTPRQREILTAAVDGLHKELHEKLVEMPKSRRTLPQSGTMNENEDDGSDLI